MTSITHRDITIMQAEVPGAPFAWVHDDAGGSAGSLDEAKRQIDAHLGPEKHAKAPCGACGGRGLIHWHPHWDNGHDDCPTCGGRGWVWEGE